MKVIDSNIKRKIRGNTILFGLVVISFLVMKQIPAIEQNLQYHDFHDARTLLSIPNFWNVISNLPFAIIGLIGVFKLKTIAGKNIQYFIFFLGIFLVAIGSSLYHISPNNQTLVGDRLPMTVAFMSLFSIVISEFINKKTGYLMLIPLLCLGLFSVWYWAITDDLRWYAMVQFYPIFAILFILIYYKSEYTKVFGYWILLIAYAIAKFLEHNDSQVFNTLGFISGHSLKHIISAIGLSVLLYSFLKREKLEKIEFKIKINN